MIGGFGVIWVGPKEGRWLSLPSEFGRWFILTGGQASSWIQGWSILEGLKSKAILAHKGCITRIMLWQKLLKWRIKWRVKLPFPLNPMVKISGKNPRHFDQTLYKEPNVTKLTLNKQAFSFYCAPLDNKQLLSCLSSLWLVFAYGLNIVMTHSRFSRAFFKV